VFLFVVSSGCARVIYSPEVGSKRVWEHYDFETNPSNVEIMERKSGGYTSKTDDATSPLRLGLVCKLVRFAGVSAGVLVGVLVGVRVGVWVGVEVFCESCFAGFLDEFLVLYGFMGGETILASYMAESANFQTPWDTRKKHSSKGVGGKTDLCILTWRQGSHQQRRVSPCTIMSDVFGVHLLI
jgi:hypothetical protein